MHCPCVWKAVHNRTFGIILVLNYISFVSPMGFRAKQLIVTCILDNLEGHLNYIPSYGTDFQQINMTPIPFGHFAIVLTS